MKGMHINSIYLATEGEGIHLGTPQVFVRFQGCAVGCVNCDSKDTWEFKAANLTLDEVLCEVQKHSVKAVSITGGDPLHPKLAPQSIELARALKQMGYRVNVEAAGTRILDELFDIIDFVSFDYKTPSTKVSTPLKLLSQMETHYKGKFQVKSVVQDKRDFDYVIDAHGKLKELGEFSFPWVITPSFLPSETFPAQRFQNIIEWNYESGSLFRVIGQQHKWFYGPEFQEV